MPQSPLCAIRYDARSSWVKWGTGTASRATIAGRIELGLTVPWHLQQYVGEQTGSADLWYRQGRFSLHGGVSLAEPAQVHTPEVIGIDLGLAHPAVTSTHVCLGEGRWRAQEARLFRLKRKLQAKGTQSAKRHLKGLSRKRFRQHTDRDHVLSKRLVQNTPPGATLVLENLKNIGESSKIGRSKKNKTLELKRRFHTWSFAQVEGFLAYKAAWRGITVVKGDPRKTSQSCSHCGHQHRSHRKSPSFFRCRSCGYRVNADSTASQTIRNTYVASLASIATSGAGGFLVSEPLVSTPNG